MSKKITYKSAFKDPEFYFKELKSCSIHGMTEHIINKINKNSICLKCVKDIFPAI